MYTEKRFYHIILDRILSAFTDKIIACSNSVLDFTMEQEGIRKDKFSLLYNAVDVEKFNISDSKEQLRNNTVFLVRILLSVPQVPLFLRKGIVFSSRLAIN